MGKSRERTIRGDRLHIGFFGRRNAGKSSLINAITNQATAIVSELPGTTTDPVYKAMELAPLGPVVLIDTAGLDDNDPRLGHLRTERTRKILQKTDLALLVVDSTLPDLDFENRLLEEIHKLDTAYVIVLNKIDTPVSPAVSRWLQGKPHVPVSSKNGTGILRLKQQVAELAPQQWEPPFIRDLVQPGEVVVLVIPIDTGAPKGRLIMPQVKALRDILDGSGIPLMCQESELSAALQHLKRPPALVVIDSQVFAQVAAIVPREVPLTSFSILSARQKGDLAELVEGVRAVESLQPGDRVLIAEACTHHPQADDIGRLKIPRWLREYVGAELRFDIVSGADFPEQIGDYRLVVHCGACTLNRKALLWRQRQARQQGVAITNYGVLIAFLKHLLPRALQPYPELYRLLTRQESPGDSCAAPTSRAAGADGLSASGQDVYCPDPVSVNVQGVRP
jgi:[FeFe] hydrogenase H-cluster maturation GTPase HydF